MSTIAVDNDFIPCQWQIAPLEDESPILVIAGASGSGKTRVAAEKVANYCMMYPNAIALVFGDTVHSTMSLFIYAVLRSKIHNGTAWVGKTNWVINFHNGSRIMFSANSSREDILSCRFDIVLIDNAIGTSREDYNRIASRLRVRDAAAGWRQIILTIDKVPVRHWIYGELIRPKLAKMYLGSVGSERCPNIYLVNNRNYMTRLIMGSWDE